MPEFLSGDSRAETVNGRTAETADPRLLEVMASLVTHLLAFIKDVDWRVSYDFILAADDGAGHDAQSAS